MRKKTGRIKATKKFSVAIKDYIKKHQLTICKLGSYTNIHSTTVGRIKNIKTMWEGEEHNFQKIACHIGFNGEYIEKLPDEEQPLASPSIHRRKGKAASSGG